MIRQKGHLARASRFGGNFTITVGPTAARGKPAAAAARASEALTRAAAAASRMGRAAVWAASVAQEEAVRPPGMAAAACLLTEEGLLAQLAGANGQNDLIDIVNPFLPFGRTGHPRRLASVSRADTAGAEGAVLSAGRDDTLTFVPAGR
jgi:hypothetical protein